jgi:hypothetical protein
MPYGSINRVGIVELLRNSHFGIQYNTDPNKYREPYIKTTDGIIHNILPADFIAVLVSFYGKDILIDNPYIDEIIVDADPFDKTKRARFFYLLKKRK